MSEQPMTESAAGVWRHSIPIRPTGLLGWKVARACRKAGGHFFHSTKAGFSFECCRCGYEDENPFMPKGHLCGPADTEEPNDG